MTKSESKLILTPVKIDLKTKEVLSIQNITFIDLESGRNYILKANEGETKTKQGVWLLAIHSKIKDYINGKETVKNTFVR